jgi:hypothetical protein
VDVIADVDEPLADISVDSRVDRARMPGGRLARQGESLDGPDGRGPDGIDEVWRGARLLRGIGDTAVFEEAVDADGDEGDDEHGRENDGAFFQASAGVGVEGGRGVAAGADVVAGPGSRRCEHLSQGCCFHVHVES